MEAEVVRVTLLQEGHTQQHVANVMEVTHLTSVELILVIKKLVPADVERDKILDVRLFLEMIEL